MHARIRGPSWCAPTSSACPPIRRQYAVFLCRQSARDLVRLKGRLYDLINLKEDQVIFVPICNRDAKQMESLGRPIERFDAKDVVMVV